MPGHLILELSGKRNRKTKGRVLMRKKISRFLVAVLMLAMIFSGMMNTRTVSAWDNSESTVKILMVGNSLTRYNNVADKLTKLFAYKGITATIDTRTQMGASLYDQADILAESTEAAIMDGDYDYVILQEKSSGFNEALLRQGVEAFSDWIETAPSAPQLILYMPWANEDVFKSMQTTFTDAYVAVAKDYDAILAPSGEAYYDLYFNEGKEWYRDGDNVHGNDLASLVSASTIFYSIMNEAAPIEFNLLADQLAVQAMVESADYRNYPVKYDLNTINLIEEKAFEYAALYSDLNDVPDLTGRGVDETVNLAKGKQGVASSNARGSSAGVGPRNVGNLTDGSKTSYIVLHSDDTNPWFGVDFGEATEFNQLSLYWGATGDYADSYRNSFVVEGSNDENALNSTSATFTQLATGESTGTEEQVVSFADSSYRYVRVRVTNIVGAYASMYELEAYKAAGGGSTDEATVNVGDYLQIKVGAATTDMSLYTGNMYEATASFAAGAKDFSILCNGAEIYKGAITPSESAQNIIIRYFAKDNTVVTGQDTHEDANGNPVQDIKKVANWTGNFFSRTGIEEFKEFGGWDQASPLSTLDYIGGGVFERVLTYTVPTEASVTYQYKINFDSTWNNGEVPADNKSVTFPVSGKGTDTFTLWVNSITGELFDSINDGTTTFKIDGNDSYAKAIGTADVKLSLASGSTPTEYKMVQTGLDNYMVTVFIEPGTYSWMDVIDGNDGTLSGEFTITEKSAVTFFYNVSADKYEMLNTVDNAAEFFAAEGGGSTGEGGGSTGEGGGSTGEGGGSTGEGSGSTGEGGGSTGEGSGSTGEGSGNTGSGNAGAGNTGNGGSSAGSGNASPNLGDNTPVAMMLIILIGAAAATGSALYIRKKHCIR